ncbi:MAG: phosphatase PAP2 family protein [Bacteroidetes bacterium]|nr:phosphatase PAP2 family protein [Bacteroidota bacterium]
MQNASTVFFLLLFVSAPNFAQSPYSISWKNDGLIMGSSAAISLFAVSLNDSLHVLTPAERFALNKNSINIFDRWATNFASVELSQASDLLVGACIVAPAGLLLFDKNIGSDWQTISTMYAETALLATFLPSLGKGPAKRIRPYLYNPNAPLKLQQDDEANRSFFSGHTTWSFASMTFLAVVYSDFYPNSKYKTAVWTVSMSAASAVGLMRIFSGAHFPSDVLLGALVGGTIGYGIPYLHRVSSSSVGVVPSPFGGMQLSLSVPLR